jgi:hypothetical protein
VSPVVGVAFLSVSVTNGSLSRHVRACRLGRLLHAPGLLSTSQLSNPSTQWVAPRAGIAYLELVLAVLLAELGQVGVPAARVARQVRAQASAHTRQAHLTPQISSICRTNCSGGAAQQAAHSNLCLQPRPAASSGRSKGADPRSRDTVYPPAHAAVVTICEVVPPLERLRYARVHALSSPGAFRLLAPRMDARPLAHSTLLLGLVSRPVARRAGRGTSELGCCAQLITRKAARTERVNC